MTPQIIPDPDTKTVTIIGNAKTITFKAGRMITFTGLDFCYMIGEVFPNGAYLLDSRDSILRFYSWRTLFSTNSGRKIWNKNARMYLPMAPSIFLDAIQVTGWIEIK